MIRGRFCAPKGLEDSAMVELSAESCSHLRGTNQPEVTLSKWPNSRVKRDALLTTCAGS